MGAKGRGYRDAAERGRRWPLARWGTSKKRNHEGKGDLASRGSRAVSVADLGAEREVGAAEVLGDDRRTDQQEHRDDDEALPTEVEVWEEEVRGDGGAGGSGGASHLHPADLRAAEHPHPVELGGGADPELGVEEAGLHEGLGGERGGER